MEGLKMSKTVEYNGQNLAVYGGAWLDVMNSCFYTVIDKIEGYDICQKNEWDKNGNLNGAIFALPH